MTGFSVREINDQSIGDTLREKRLSREETLEDIEKATQITKKYLVALEANDFDKLPEPVYSRNFVRTLSNHYGLNADLMVRALSREMTAVTGSTEAVQPVNHIAGRKLVATPLVIKSVLAGVFFIAVAAYFGLSIRQILKPPKLVIHSPHDSEVFHDQRVVLEGETEPEVKLTVNRENVLIESDGTFKETLTLPDGVSVLRVAAKKKHSKEHEVYLKVIVEAEDGQIVAVK